MLRTVPRLRVPRRGLALLSVAYVVKISGSSDTDRKGKTMRELTERSRRNLAKGGTTGPGTMTCAKCGGAKEDSRINSVTCRGCDGSVGARQPATVDAGLAEQVADLTARLDKQAAAIIALRKRVTELEDRL